MTYGEYGWSRERDRKWGAFCCEGGKRAHAGVSHTHTLSTPPHNSRKAKLERLRRRGKVAPKKGEGKRAGKKKK